MQAEFVRDDSNNIWFIFAHKVHFRRPARNSMNELLQAFVDVG
jgi:hypothetical protein